MIFHSLFFWYVYPRNSGNSHYLPPKHQTLDLRLVLGPRDLLFILRGRHLRWIRHWSTFMPRKGGIRSDQNRSELASWISCHMGVSIAMGVPPNSWMVLLGKIPLKWMMTGGPSIYGNPHIVYYEKNQTGTVLHRKSG